MLDAAALIKRILHRLVFLFAVQERFGAHAQRAGDVALAETA